MSEASCYEFKTHLRIDGELWGRSRWRPHEPIRPGLLIVRRSAMSVREGTGARTGLVVAVLTDDKGADVAVDVLWGPWRWRPEDVDAAA